VPERYLGLVPRFENAAGAEYFARATAAVTRAVDLDALLRRSHAAEVNAPVDASPFPLTPMAPRARLAVARDRAFGFYYADALDLLGALGLEIAAFSPLADGTLPPETDGVYVGGGFPELFAADLAANKSLLRALREAAGGGLPVYAECGGLMYLARSLVDAAGERHALASLVPAEVSLHAPRLMLGYREATGAGDSMLLSRGENVRGHEFHYSRLTTREAARPAYLVADREPAAEGYAHGSLFASYLHLHLAGAPPLAQRLVDACAALRARRAA
jgi:cobyrinic acid a,c-diamide synthase